MASGARRQAPGRQGDAYDLGGQDSGGETDEPFDLALEAAEALLHPPAPVVVIGAGIVFASLAPAALDGLAEALFAGAGSRLLAHVRSTPISVPSSSIAWAMAPAMPSAASPERARRSRSRRESRLEAWV